MDFNQKSLIIRFVEIQEQCSFYLPDLVRQVGDWCFWDSLRNGTMLLSDSTDKPLLVKRSQVFTKEEFLVKSEGRRRRIEMY